jgi:hypothetical protein
MHNSVASIMIFVIWSIPLSHQPTHPPCIFEATDLLTNAYIIKQVKRHQVYFMENTVKIGKSIA